MSQKQMRAVIDRARRDPSFRQLLQSDPNQALAGFDLTASEITELQSLDANTLSGTGISSDPDVRGAV